VGGRRYAEHPTTEVLCCVLSCEGEEQIWLPGDPAPDLPKRFEAAAHNAIGFDRHIWNRIGWPQPRRWIDTAQLARVAGYPRADLDWLGVHLLGQAKDKEGSKLTKSLSARFPLTTRRKVKGSVNDWTHTPHPKAGQWRINPIPPEVRTRMITYCRSDVAILKGIFPLLLPFDDIDRRVRDADLTIIDRGIGFDVEMAQALIEASEHMAQATRDAAGIDVGSVRSNAKFMREMALLGVDLENCQKATLGAILEAIGESEDEADNEIRELIEARLGTNTIAAGKLRAGLLRVCPDSRLRDSLKYHAAHTGRWGGQGFQPHNLTKPA
jgi:hypothetical protein